MEFVAGVVRSRRSREELNALRVEQTDRERAIVWQKHQLTRKRGRGLAPSGYVLGRGFVSPEQSYNLTFLRVVLRIREPIGERDPHLLALRTNRDSARAAAEVKTRHVYAAV